MQSDAKRKLVALQRIRARGQHLMNQKEIVAFDTLINTIQNAHDLVKINKKYRFKKDKY